MKKVLLTIAVGMVFGFIDSTIRNSQGELIAILGRGFFATLLVSAGFVMTLVNEGTSIKNSILKCNKTALIFFGAYFIGAMLSKLFWQN